MTSDDLRIVLVEAEDFAYTLRNITVRCTVETIATNMILLVQLIRNSIEISVVWHGTMECVIKYANLWCTRHQCVNGTNTL